MSHPRSLVSRRATVACLVLAPLLEVVEGALSPLTGQSNRADLAAVAQHQGAMEASVVVGLASTLLYVPGFVGLASRTAARSRRTASLGLGFSLAAILGFGGARMVGAVQVSADRVLGVAGATRLVDHLATNPLAVVALLALVLGGLLGYPLLAASAWRAGLPRPAAAWFFAFPFVALVADDNHWGNLVTHVLLAAALGWLGSALTDDVLPARRLLGDRALVVVLIAAPALEVLEQVLSPLSGTSTRADLSAIAAHDGAYVISVMIGVAATALYVAGFLGLAARCAGVAPVAARIGAFVSVASMICFAGVRTAQGVELQLARDHVAPRAAASVVDGIGANPAGAMILIVFLAGSVVGLVALAVAAWKRGLPRPAVLYLGAFPVVDLVLPGHLGTLASHGLLLVALASIALALRETPVSGAAVPEVAPAA